VRPNEDTVEIFLRGEFDLSSIHASQEVLEFAAERVAEKRRPVVVDLASLTFFDAAGIKFLVRLETVAGIASTTFCVRNASRDIRRLIEIVGLEKLLRD